MEISDHTKLQLLNLLASALSEPRQTNVPLSIAPYCNILFTAPHQAQDALSIKLSDAQEAIADKAIASFDGSTVSLIPLTETVSTSEPCSLYFSGDTSQVRCARVADVLAVLQRSGVSSCDATFVEESLPVFCRSSKSSC